MITADPASLKASLEMLDGAVEQVIASLDHNVLATIGDDSLLEYLKDFEKVRTRLGLVDQHLVAAVEETKLAPRMAQCKTARFLINSLRIEAGEAHRRVRAARALHSSMSMLGERLDPERPVLAAAVAAGDVGSGSADRIVSCLNKFARLPFTTADELDSAEEILTEAAQKVTPEDLKIVIDELATAIDPDGALSDDQRHESLRDLYLWQASDGSFHIQGHLTPATGQKLKAVLDPLSKPQATPDEPDLRSGGQRLHDGLDEACGRLLQDDDLPATGGTPATVHVIIDWKDLIKRTGHGRFADGSTTSPDTVVKIGDQAELFVSVLAANGRVLDFGRDRRIADKSQTAAMMARDAGCSFPGCDRAPKWCERHHVISWLDGGETTIDNLTLVCRFHHRHFEDLGWRCQMIDGLPHWIPPKWIDREQKPRLHHRIQLRHQGKLVN